MSIEEICNKYEIVNYTINDDGSIDVDRWVELYDNQLTELPLKFNKVNGHFHCGENNLTTLEGSPKWVSDDFYCYDNNLTSLKGSPQVIGGNFYCYDNKLTNLDGIPEKIGKGIYCDYNKLTSLKGCPEIINGDFDCSGNFLTSLKDGPKEVSLRFWCHTNMLNSLEGGPEYVGGLYNCRGNKLTSLKGIAKKVGFDREPLKVGGSIGDGVCFHENMIKNFDDFDCEFKGELMGVRNPITCLIGKKTTDDDYEFVSWFKKLNVVFDKNKLDLKRFKYLMNMFPHKYDDSNYIRNHIHYIKKNYEIID